MTPDPAPTVQQLLAFYLEAGVDCALTEEPVNRLTDPDIAAGRDLPSPSETPQPGLSERRPPRWSAMRAEAAPGAGGRHRVGTGSGADRAFT